MSAYILLIVYTFKAFDCHVGAGAARARTVGIIGASGASTATHALQSTTEYRATNVQAHNISSW